MKLFTKDINNKLFKQFQSGNDLDNQRVIAKIFNPYGKGRWFLVNSDPQDPDYLWAIVQMGDIVEVGSVLRSELESIRVSPFRFPLERDLGFSEVNAGELLRGLDKGKFYKEGGSVEYAGGGMTAGRWYRDNTGVEYRYIGENSQGQLLFSDGEKTIVRDEEDFNSVPEEKKLFGIFKEGGTLSMDDYEMNDDRWFLIENGMILKGKLTQPAARKAAEFLSKKNPNKKYSVTWIEDYESDDNYEEGGETEPFSKTGKGKFVSTDDRLNICSQQLFDKNYSDCTKDERNKAFDLFLDKYAISYSSKRKMAKGGDLYDDMDEDIKFANKKVRMIAKSLDGLGFNILEVNEADYDTNANIVLSKDTNVDIGLDGEMSIVIEKNAGLFTFIDCKKSYATLLQKLKDVDPKYLPKRNGVDSIKLTLSKKDSYDYIYTQDGTKNSITFAFGKGAFQFDVKKISPELEKYEQDILDAFVIQGIKQHDYKGGFTEAIQHLDTKVVQEANNNLETGGELDWGEDLGDGFSVGNDVYINDRNSRFYDRTGYVIGKLGQSLVIRVGDDEMDAVVRKNGVERLEAPEFAKGGNVNSDLSDKELKDLVERLSKEKTLDKREDYALMKAKYMLEKRDNSSKMADGGMVTLYDDYDKSAGYIIEKGNQYWTGKNWSDVKAYAESYKTKQEAEKKLKSTKMAKGGETQDGVDLFEDYDNIPTKVSKILEKYDFEDSTYDELKKVNKELEKIGYTFEYGLDGTAYDLRKIGQKGKSEVEYAKGGEITPYIIWVSKDGEKRELFGNYKSKRAADMQMNKLWEKGEYKSMGNKPKSMYEKEGFYAKGGEMKQNYIVKLLDALRLAMKRSEGNRWYTHGTIVSLKGYDKMSLNYLIPNDYPISDKYRVGLEAKLSYKKDNVEYNYEFSTKNKEKSESIDNARKITWIYMPLTQDVAKQIYNQLEKQGDIKEIETWSMENSYEKGGKVKFEDKVKAIKASLLKTKKVPKKVQKDYGKTYNAKEAELAAKRIAGSIVKKKNMKKGGTIQDEYDKLRKIEHNANKSYYRARNTINWFEGIGGNYNLKWDKQIEKLKKLDGFEPKYDFGDVIA